ncbi:MAG: cytochrome P460 family protein [Geminicoccaceae bacterium]
MITTNLRPATIIGATLLGIAGMTTALLIAMDTQLAAAAEGGPAKITDDNSTSIPDGFREWVFLGAPLTPNGLNGGEAGFPEFHHVYVEPGAYAEYKATGEFPEGTTIVKELVLLKEGDYEDGSRDEASGRGFFAKEFAGIDMMVKDSDRFAETDGWGFFNFGHHAPPYAETAAAAPNESCAFCHTASATHDMVFTTFYPILEKP